MPMTIADNHARQKARTCLFIVPPFLPRCEKIRVQILDAELESSAAAPPEAERICRSWKKAEVDGTSACEFL
jgi:hypothetical protein